MAKTINISGKLPKIPAQGGSFGLAPKAGATATIPQPEATPEGIRGQLPLPSGRPVSVKNLTPGELAVMKSIPGWKEGDPIPPNMYEVVEQIQSDLKNPPLPVAANTPAMQLPNEIPIDQLSPERQAEIKDFMAQVKNDFQQQAAAEAAAVEGAGDGVNNAILAATQIEIEDDTASPNYSMGVPKSAPEPARETATSPTPGHGHCPQCDWDLARNSVVDVTAADKEVFLAALLGGQCFRKTFELMGGKLQVTVRALRMDEQDLCFKQTHLDRDKGKVNSPEAFWEQLMRYQLGLQIIDVRGESSVQDLPDTLEGWVESFKGHAPEGADDTILTLINSYMFSEVVKSENMGRILTQQVGKFNALCARMEANSANENFWKASSSED